jgi:hypothetical protein
LALILVSLNYSKDFIIFSFSSEENISSVLLQQNQDNNEKTITFMSKNLRGVELKYTINKNQDYTLVQSLHHFRIYVRYNKIIAYVPYPVVKDVLTQKECLGGRGKWVSKIQECDLYIKPTKIIKGKGLAKMLS